MPLAGRSAFRRDSKGAVAGVFVATINPVRITFDPAKDRSNLSEHGVSLALAAHLDWDTVMAGPDRRRDYGEPREIGYGLIDERLYCVVFARRGGWVRIISFRKANRREVVRYVRHAQNQATDR